MILTVSQRTDIPALYLDWFLKRIDEGFLYVNNPYDDKTTININLSPSVIDCIVFFSKDVSKIINHLDKFEQYNYYFHITLTAYQKDVEPNQIDKKQQIKDIIKLSKLIGPDKVVIRYDPIFLTDIYTIDYHKRAFDKLISTLYKYSNTYIFNFLDIYPKMKYNMDKHNISDLNLDQRRDLINYYKEVTNKYNVDLKACMKHSLITGLDIKMASCIDGELVEKISGKLLNNMDINTKSRACNCMPYVDIGVYDTCALNCAYCYANSHSSNTKRKYQMHDKNSPILFGEINYDNIVNHKRNVSNFTNQRQTKLDL